MCRLSLIESHRSVRSGKGHARVPKTILVENDSNRGPRRLALVLDVIPQHVALDRENKGWRLEKGDDTITQLSINVTCKMRTELVRGYNRKRRKINLRCFFSSRRRAIPYAQHVAGSDNNNLSEVVSRLPQSYLACIHMYPRLRSHPDSRLRNGDRIM